MSPTTKPDTRRAAALRLLRRAGRLLLGAAFPPRCLACADFIAWPHAGADPELAGAERWFCAPCLATLAPLQSPCPRCARSLRRYLDAPPLDACPDCARSSPEWRAIAAYAHEGPAREALHHLKFSERRHVAAGIARLMARAVAPSLGERRPELLVPIPLGPARLQERGYNQARLIAEALGPLVAIPVVVEGALVRPRQSASQHRLGRQERLGRGEELMFRVDRPAEVEGRAVALVDDVMTTGATARAAAEALEGAGACVERVWIWSRA